MKRIILIILLLQMSVAFALGASVEATVDDPNVVEGNSVRLTLEATGEDVKFPTIQQVGDSPVEGVSNSAHSSIKVMNGKVTRENVKKQTLLFTPLKAMTIPSFSIEVDGQVMKTNPIDIKIVQSAAPTPGSSKKVSLDMVANKQKVFVGEPLLISVFFNESKQLDLMKVEYQKPVFKDFFTKDVDGEKTYQKGGFLVHELRYILTPKYEGNFTIEPARARIAERGRHKDDFFGTFFDTPIWSRIVSNALQVEVKPSPEDTDLIGDLKLSETIDATEVKANKPVNLTIKISGEGNLEDFDGLKYEIDGVTIYSDDAKIESNLQGSQLISSYEKKFVFIADHNFTIPSKSFTLFNFKTGKVETLKTESRQITVKGGQATTPSVIKSTKPQAIAKRETNVVSEEKKVEKVENRTEPPASWMLIFAFFGGVVLTLGAVKLLPLLKWKRVANPMKESEAIKILYPHTSDDPMVEEMVRKLYAKKGGDKRIVIDKAALKSLVDRYREL
jgi:hypothetical protein